jgi:hypothetical protein
MEISDVDFEELKGCIELIVLRLSEHRKFDDAKGESLYRAEQEAEKAMQIIRRLEGTI